MMKLPEQCNSGTTSLGLLGSKLTVLKITNSDPAPEWEIEDNRIITHFPKDLISFDALTF